MPRALPLRGHLSQPGDGPAPSVILIHEWWGLNESIKKVSQRLSQEGFMAFAIDLYGGRVTRDAQSAAHYMNSLDWNQVETELREAVVGLGALNPGKKIGVMGFCLGGALSLFAAAKVPEIKACVPFYGIPDASRVDLSRIRVPVLGHWANRDKGCTPERVDALERQFQQAGTTYEFHRYDADHAFFNESRPEVYSPIAAQQAWERTLRFLRHHLT